jgi:hypothetical protein
MLEHSKKILKQVSFDRLLFKKELLKALKWIKSEEVLVLKTWCLATFTHYSDVISEAFESIS